MIRLKISLTIGRGEPREPVHKTAEIPPHDVVEGGAYIDRVEQPRYIGFRPDEPMPE